MAKSTRYSPAHTLHHKTIVIDKKIVVTGSFNPSDNAQNKNDENILIIHDERIAKKFIDEFLSLVS